MNAIALGNSSLSALPPFLAIPCFDEPMARNGQLRLGLERRVPLPGLDPRFAEGLLRLPLARPLFDVAIITPRPVVLPAAPARQAPERQNRVPTIIVTPLMEQIERIVRRLAAAGHEMPGNPALGELADGRGRQSAARTLERLEAIGRIRIEVKDGRRRVHVPAPLPHDPRHELATGWGPFATGTHAPFSSNPRGSQPASAPVRLDYKPVEHTPFRYRIEPAKLVETRPALECQWPLWQDGDRYDHRFCGVVTVADKRGRRTSWCKTHFDRVWPGRE